MTEQSQGPATDRKNDPVVDPTKNVLDLVQAANRRQDDLRKLEAKHLREILALRTTMYNKLRKAEAHRIDAIRTVDVAAVQRAQEVQAEQAGALARTVTAAAEAHRAALDAALTPLNLAIADLRQAQYQAQGQKTQVVESSSKSGSIGLWVGIAVAGLFGALSFLAAAAGLVIAFIPR